MPQVRETAGDARCLADHEARDRTSWARRGGFTRSSESVPQFGETTGRMPQLRTPYLILDETEQPCQVSRGRDVVLSVSCDRVSPCQPTAPPSSRRVVFARTDRTWRPAREGACLGFPRSLPLPAVAKAQVQVERDAEVEVEPSQVGAFARLPVRCTARSDPLDRSISCRSARGLPASARAPRPTPLDRCSRDCVAVSGPGRPARRRSAPEVRPLSVRTLVLSGLAGFVTERAAGGDYRSRLGVMTQIREDFQHMASR